MVKEDTHVHTNMAQDYYKHPVSSEIQYCLTVGFYFGKDGRAGFHHTILRYKTQELFPASSSIVEFRNHSRVLSLKIC